VIGSQFGPSPAAPDHNRNANSIAETDPANVPLDFAEVRFAAATTATALAWASAGRPARHARRLAGKRETGQRHSYEAARETFQGLPPRDGLGHTFSQLIKFVVHNSFLFLYGVWCRPYDA
jgi:hypothetical protein